MTDPKPITFTPLTRFRVQVALDQKRIRRADYTRYVLALTLNDGTMLKLTGEADTIIALRCLTSGAHAGLSPSAARAAEREAAAASSPAAREHA